MKSSPESRTAYALLGFLAWRPMSGYDLKQVIARSVGSFWAEGYAQIYPVLRRMSEAGWIAKRSECGTGQRTRHVYEITPSGRDRLRAWLDEPVAETPPRIELLLKVFFGSEVPVAVSVAHVEATRGRASERLAEYLSIATDLERRREHNPDALFWRLTVDYGIEAMRARLRWCDRALAELQGLAERDSANTEPSRNGLVRPAEQVRKEHQR